MLFIINSYRPHHMMAALVAALLVAPLSAPARHRNQQPGLVLKRNVQLVLTPVTVKDRHSRLLPALTRNDFRIFVDGKERSVKYFSNEVAPLAAVVLVDTGLSVTSIDTLRNALPALQDDFLPADVSEAYTFDNTINRLLDFTPRPEQWVKALAKALPEGAGSGPYVLGGPIGGPGMRNGTPINQPATVAIGAPQVGKRMMDALYVASQQLRNQPPARRRVILIISDGVNGSDNNFSYHDVVQSLQRRDVSVYAVNFGLGWILKKKEVLSRLASATGGDDSFVQRKNALEDACVGLMNEARSAYTLGFTPAVADGEWHRIEVRVSKRGARLIARRRFLAPVGK